MANLAISSFLLSVVCCYAAPLQGSDLPPRSDGVAVVNEPCYVHDASCDGYPVCCVKVGDCIAIHSGTISSNTAYYEGGCQSLDSSKTSWAEDSGCTQQGECLVQHLEVCKGGSTKEGFMGAVPAATLERFMEGSCEASCPSGGYHGHGSYGSYGGEASESNVTATAPTPTPPTPAPTAAPTPAPTISVALHGRFTMESSDASSMVMTEDKKNELFGMLIAHMAGSDVSTSMVSYTIETSDALNSVHFTVTMSHTDSAESQQAEKAVDEAFKGMTTAQMDEVAAKIFGTCAYTLSASGPVCVGSTSEDCEAAPEPEPEPASGPTPEPALEPTSDPEPAAALAARCVSSMMVMASFITIIASPIWTGPSL